MVPLNVRLLSHLWSVTVFLTCRFLLDLHQARYGTTGSSPSSPSEISSLNFRATDSRRRSHETLPAFIASMGSLVHVPELNSVDPPGEEGGVSETRGDEGGSREDIFAHEADEEVRLGMSDMLVAKQDKSEV